MSEKLRNTLAKTARFTLWLNLVGCSLLLGGLGWDGLLHGSDPTLAVLEGVFSLSNPAHLLAGVGIGLIVVSLVLSLLDRARHMTKAAPVRGLVLVLFAFGIIGLVSFNLYLGLRNDLTFTVEDASSADEIVTVNDYNDLKNNPKYAYYYSDSTSSQADERHWPQSAATGNPQAAHNDSAQSSDKHALVVQPGSKIYYISSSHGSRSKPAPAALPSPTPTTGENTQNSP